MEPLEYLEKAHIRGELDTWPLVLIRHAKAKPRSSWTKAEGDRPSAATGQRQAAAVQRLLEVWKPQRIVTSPWTRCVATIAPYAKSSGAKVKLVEALTEHNHHRAPKKTAAAVEGLFDKQVPIAVCTHRPALPTVLKQLGQHMSAALRGLLPTSDPFLSPGEVIVCQVARGSERKIVSVEQVKPFDD